MERSRDEVVDEVIGEVVVGEVIGEVVFGLKQRCVFGCSLGRELWRWSVPILVSIRGADGASDRNRRCSAGSSMSSSLSSVSSITIRSFESH